MRLCNVSNECFLVEDITYSRIDVEHKILCDSMNGCKCRTNKCYYGDPCLCDVHTLGCPIHTSLNENGGNMTTVSNYKSNHNVCVFLFCILYNHNEIFLKVNVYIIYIIC